LDISTRIKSILKTQILELLELEVTTSPEKAARKDIDQALVILRTELGRTLARRHRLKKALPEAQAALLDMAGKVEVAVSHDADDLARAAIARKLELETYITELGEDITTCEAEAKELEKLIDHLMVRNGQDLLSTNHEFDSLEAAFEDLDRKIKKRTS